MRLKLTLALLGGFLLLDGALAIPMNQSPARALDGVQSDKYDGGCGGQETMGRCADKCPEPQQLQGYEPETGAAICSQPVQTVPPVPAEPIPAGHVNPPPEFVGK